MGGGTGQEEKKGLQYNEKYGSFLTVTFIILLRLILSRRYALMYQISNAYSPRTTKVFDIRILPFYEKAASA